MTSLERQLVNSLAPEIAVITQVFTHILHRSGVNSLCAHSMLVFQEQTRIATTSDRLPIVRYYLRAMIIQEWRLFEEIRYL